MEDFITNLGWKKIAIISVGVALLGLVYVAISFNTIDSKSNKTKKENLIKNNYETTIKKSGFETSTVKTYTTPYFEISYPENYDVTLFTPVKGILSYVGLEEKDKKAKMLIRVYSDQEKNFDEVMSIFSPLPYKKTDIAIGKLTGVEMSGALGTTNKLQEKIVILRKENMVIQITFDYMAQVADEKLDAEYTAIVQSMH